MVGAIFGAIAQSYGDSARQNMELKAQLYARSEQQKADTRGPISTIFNSINLPKDVDKEDFIEAAVNTNLSTATWRGIADQVVIGGQNLDGIFILPQKESGTVGMKLGDTGYSLNIPALKPKVAGRSDKEKQADAFDRYRKWHNELSPKYDASQETELLADILKNLDTVDEEYVYSSVWGDGAKQNLFQSITIDKLGFIRRMGPTSGTYATGTLQVTKQGYDYLEKVYKDDKKDMLKKIQDARGESSQFIIIDGKPVLLQTMLINSQLTRDWYTKTMIAFGRGNPGAQSVVNEAIKTTHKDLNKLNAASTKNLEDSSSGGEGTEVKEIPPTIIEKLDTDYTPAAIQNFIIERRKEEPNVEALEVIKHIARSLSPNNDALYEMLRRRIWDNWSSFIDQQQVPQQQTIPYSNLFKGRSNV